MMPAGIRTNKKAQRAFFEVKGKPSYYNMDKTSRQKAFDERINSATWNTYPAMMYSQK